jgi:hypothetical protein
MNHDSLYRKIIDGLKKSLDGTQLLMAALPAQSNVMKLGRPFSAQPGATAVEMTDVRKYANLGEMLVEQLSSYVRTRSSLSALL